MYIRAYISHPVVARVNSALPVYLNNYLFIMLFSMKLWAYTVLLLQNVISSYIHRVTKSVITKVMKTERKRLLNNTEYKNYSKSENQKILR